MLYNVNLAPVADVTHSCDLLMNCDFRGGPSSDPDGSNNGKTNTVTKAITVP